MVFALANVKRFPCLILTCLLLFACGVVVVATKQSPYTEKRSVLLTEIYAYQKDGLSPDFTPVLRSHVHIGEEKAQVLQYLKSMGFTVERNNDKHSYASNQFEESYIATAYLQMGWQSMFIPEEQRIFLKFNNSKLAKFTGTSFSQNP